jgi:hypothetical protein
MHRENLSHFGSKKSYAKWRSSPLAVLPPKLLIVLSAASSTAGVLFLEEDTFFGIFARFKKATISFVIIEHLSTRLSFAWNNSVPTGRIFIKFVSCEFSKVFRENSSITKIGKEKPVLYTKTNIHFCHILLKSTYNEECLEQICRDTRN